METTRTQPQRHIRLNERLKCLVQYRPYTVITDNKEINSPEDSLFEGNATI